MDIRCRKTTCKYNKTHSCFAESIKITKKVQCDTYYIDTKREIENENKANDMSKKLFKKPIKDSPHRSRKTIHILCDADCLFNEKGICKANGITVNDLGEPYCVSFLKR
ncbi:MAG: DUF1540 domain-containing protein [Clostridia bacterium]|nr:DUF1540 domain-containing protein [Clostridia bacterium]